MVLEKLIWLFAGHFLGDFPLQPEWMANNKGKSWEINAYHALVYTATILVVVGIGGLKLSIPALLVILVSHFVIDPLKARWQIITAIWFDQLLHLGILILVARYL